MLKGLVVTNKFINMVTLNTDVEMNILWGDVCIALIGGELFMLGDVVEDISSQFGMASFALFIRIKEESAVDHVIGVKNVGCGYRRIQGT